MIAILCAMDKEFELMSDKLQYKMKHEEDIVSGYFVESGKNVIVAKSGIGKVNAAITAYKMIIQYRAECIISVGVAGGIDSSLRLGDVVIGNSYCYHDVWCGEPNVLGQVQGLPAVYPSCFGKWLDKIGTMDVKLVTIASGDWFMQSEEDVERCIGKLPKVYNIGAVDMESAAIAQVCHIRNVPFMSVRIISDKPCEPNQPEQYDGFWETEAEKSFDVVYNLLK